MTKEVSVVIPTRDGRQTLHRALHSLVSSAAWIEEVIVVLSNSPAGLREFCEEALKAYQPHFNGVVIDSGSHSNGSIARNWGIEAASAPYLALLDDDDEWMDDKLTRYFGYVLRHGLKENFVLFSRAISCAEDGSQATLFPPDAYDGSPISEFILAPRGGAQTSTLLLPTELARRVRFDDALPRHQDCDFCIRLETAGAKFHFVDEILSVWYQHPGGVSKSASFEDCAAWISNHEGRFSRTAYLNYVEKELFASARRSHRLTDYRSFVQVHFSPWETCESLGRIGVRTVRSLANRLRRPATLSDLMDSQPAPTPTLSPGDAVTSAPTPRDSHRPASNVRWVGASQAVRIGTQSLGMLIFARLLLPADFGLVAMALVVTNLANILRDMGTAAAVIQRTELDQRTTAAAFWFSAAVSSVIGLAICVLAPLIAWGFRAPELTPLLRVLSISFPLAGLGSVHQALLERRSAFRTVARIEIVSGVTALAVAAWIASSGGGPYSLVWQTVLYSALMSLQLWFASHWRPQGVGCDRASLAGIWRFSGHLFGFNLINYCARNSDSLLLGRFAGAMELGPYSLAYRLMLFPVQNLTFVLNRALLPILSRRQHDSQHLRQLYVRMLKGIAALSAPLACLVFVLREDLVGVLLGPQWSRVAGLLAWLAPIGFVQSLLSTTGIVFIARGNTRQLMKLGVFLAVVQVAGFLIGLPWGARGVAAVYLVSNVICAVPSLHLALKELGGGFRELAAGLCSLAALVLLTGICLTAFVTATNEILGSPLLNLASGALVGAGIYAALLHWVEPNTLQQLLAILPFRRPAAGQDLTHQAARASK